MKVFWPQAVRRLVYSVLCWGVHRPGLLRWFGGMVRAMPGLFPLFVAQRDGLLAALQRTHSFSNSSHRPNLVAGEFLISMDPGPAYDADRALFDHYLARVDQHRASANEAQSLCTKLRAPEAGVEFDLIEDYLVWVVLAAVKPAFNGAACTVIYRSSSAPFDREVELRYVHEVRHVAAHLFAGSYAPANVLRRAELAADSLRSRVDAALLQMAPFAPSQFLGDFERIRKTITGLAWVSHPVTVQAGALMVQELLSRPAVYASLRERAGRLRNQAWTDQDFNETVTAHVFELMRFRPVFPGLARDVPRDTFFEVTPSVCPFRAAGSSLFPMTLAAMFDGRRIADIDDFQPGREWPSGSDARQLMFGGGPRACPAQGVAVKILTNALIGLLLLPPLSYAGPCWRRREYDGPMVSSMKLRLG